MRYQIVDERERIGKVCRDGVAQFGMLYPVIDKQPINLNMSRSGFVHYRPLSPLFCSSLLTSHF